MENASIRLKPNMEGEIIWENVPPGAVFEAEKKEGEWFEVKFRSKVGVLMAGYIHEMYVEEFKEEPKKEPVPEPAVKKPTKIAAPVQPPAKLFSGSCSRMTNGAPGYTFIGQVIFRRASVF